MESWLTKFCVSSAMIPQCRVLVLPKWVEEHVPLLFSIQVPRGWAEAGGGIEVGVEFETEVAEVETEAEAVDSLPEFAVVFQAKSRYTGSELFHPLEGHLHCSPSCASSCELSFVFLPRF